ncbi:MAG TPA: DUF6807 family protein [Gemmataceae bacterium]|nr:DUF6807 family protein [Gemmataceae bacterium]
MTRALSTLALLFALPALAAADAKITVTGGKTDEANVVCTAPVPAGEAAVQYLKQPNGSLVPAQSVKPSLLQPQDNTRYVVFVLAKLKAGETLTLAPSGPPPGVAPGSFRFVEKKGEYTDLLYGIPIAAGRPVLRYINAPHDPKNHFLTFKPFHHVFDPVAGKTFLTSGAVPQAKENLYPHHRGLFYGWNKISYDGKTADIWHGTENVFSQHEKVLSEEAGMVLGRQRLAITWHGKDGMTFATEERELTAYAVPGGTLIDFASILKTDLKSVKLDGDPQHSGFHFRANMDVANKTKGETYYLRPDGKGQPGETRNWEAKKPDPKTVNLPWDAMCFVLDGKRYTVLRINHPDNPGEARGSERDYGRFGDYFEYELTPEKPLKVMYRVWVQEGEMTGEQCAAIAAAFVSPPAAKATAGK